MEAQGSSFESVASALSEPSISAAGNPSISIVGKWRGGIRGRAGLLSENRARLWGGEGRVGSPSES